MHVRDVFGPASTYRLHAALSVVWLLLVIPSWFLWRDSLFWIAFISLYANFVSHWGAWQAVRAELVAGRAEDEAKRVAAMVATENQAMLEQIIEAVKRTEEIMEAADADEGPV